MFVKGSAFQQSKAGFTRMWIGCGLVLPRVLVLRKWQMIAPFAIQLWEFYEHNILLYCFPVSNLSLTSFKGTGETMKMIIGYKWSLVCIYSTMYKTFKINFNYFIMCPWDSSILPLELHPWGHLLEDPRTICAMPQTNKCRLFKMLCIIIIRTFYIVGLLVGCQARVIWEAYPRVGSFWLH